MSNTYTATPEIDISLLSVSRPSGKILLAAFAFLPFLDNLSGAGIGMGGQSLSLLFRVVLLIYLFYYAAVLDAATLPKVLGVAVFLFIPIALRFIAGHNFFFFANDLLRLLKTYYGIVAIYGVYSLLSRNLITENQLSSIIAVSAAIYCVWIIGVFAYSILTGTYRGRGSHGFMQAGNDVSHSVAISVPFVYWFATKRIHSSLVRNGLILLTAAALFLLFTKSGMLGLAVLAYLVYRGNSRRMKALFWFAVILVIASVVTMIMQERGIIYELYSVYLFLFRQYGIAGVLFRGRNDLVNYFAQIVRETGDIGILFGPGFTWFSARYAELSSHWTYELKNAEMDLFDLFFSHGIMGLAIILWIYIRYSRYAFLKTKAGIDLRISLFIFWIHSIFAGHAISTPIVGTYIAAILGLGYYSRHRINDERVDRSY